MISRWNITNPNGDEGVAMVIDDKGRWVLADSHQAALDEVLKEAIKWANIAFGNCDPNTYTRMRIVEEANAFLASQAVQDWRARQKEHP